MDTSCFETERIRCHILKVKFSNQEEKTTFTVDYSPSARVNHTQPHDHGIQPCDHTIKEADKAGA